MTFLAHDLTQDCHTSIIQLVLIESVFELTVNWIDYGKDIALLLKM